ncbi:DUF6455 family protein [Marinobacter alexandrii]|uniref:DUF6455 family protein n=1 Tax=Marinobacter alexandrii TaxID=2570351 RepID=UPI0032997D81
MDRLNERATLMGRMLETIGTMKGLSNGELADVDLETAARRCMCCRETEACARWLESNPDSSAGPLTNCPNAALFRSWMQS